MIIDISQYNTITDWEKVSKNVDGIIFRMGYRGYGKTGTLVLDRKFHEHVSKCTELNIPYGIYFLSQALTITEILAECTFIMEYDAVLNCSLGIWLDSEWSGHPTKNGRADKLSKLDRTILANDFFNFFNDLEIKNGLYCSDSWLDEKFLKDKLKCNHYWIARYGKNNGKKDMCPVNYYDLWQYTSVGKIDGISGNVDLNTMIDKTSYLPSIKGYNGVSIIEGLNQFGYDSSYANRKNIALKMGIKNYSGTAEQNLKMIRILSS